LKNLQTVRFEPFSELLLALFLVARCERQQGDIPGLLDGAGEAALVGGTDTRQPAGNDLAAFGYEALQQAHIAIRDGVDLLGAELADLFAAEELAATARTAGRTGCSRRTTAAAGVTAARPRLSRLPTRASGGCAALGRLALCLVGHSVPFLLALPGFSGSLVPAISPSFLGSRDQQRFSKN
jgi:hypothetical protein